MKLVAACAVLLLCVAVSIIYRDRIAADPVAFARECAARGGQIRIEFNMRQCIGAGSKQN